VFSIAYCLTHTALGRDVYLDTAAAVAERLDPAMARRLRDLSRLLSAPEDLALAELLECSTVSGSPIDDIICVRRGSVAQLVFSLSNAVAQVDVVGSGPLPGMEVRRSERARRSER
jgi:hypothetical protein